ncbi:SAM-dependent methyltransferase [Micromonospora sp. NPDC047074]|uniref:SAM-dependent methyltransferase n=1 Tax=Micromonospora sp. NPDC047074 TaxID=3154339 RepID=UPI003408D1A3
MGAGRLYLLGSGIRGSLHMTVETIQALGVCKRIFALHADREVLDWVASQGCEVVDLASRYEGQQWRAEVYQAIATELVEAAEQGDPIAFLVHGHPLFLVSATEHILELAHQRGVRTTVLSSVSSFDTVLTDLGLDHGYAVQLFDTTTLLLKGWQPNPEIPLLLFQVATTLNPSVVSGEPDRDGIRRLTELLVPHYGADHVVSVVHSAATPYEASTIQRLPLGELSTGVDELWMRPTLYVPPVH